METTQIQKLFCISQLHYTRLEHERDSYVRDAFEIHHTLCESLNLLRNRFAVIARPLVVIDVW